CLCATLAGTRARCGYFGAGGPFEPHTLGTRCRRSGGSARSRRPVRQLQHSGGLWSGHSDGVPSLSNLRKGICAGDPDAAASSGGARPGERPGLSRAREPGRARAEDARPSDRPPAAGPLTTSCYAFVLRLCATPSVLPQVSIKLPLTHLPDVLLPLLALVIELA